MTLRGVLRQLPFILLVTIVASSYAGYLYREHREEAERRAALREEAERAERLARMGRAFGVDINSFLPKGSTSQGGNRGTVLQDSP